MWAARSRSKDRVVLPEDKARWARTHKLKRYGLTEESFARLLEDQDYACAMCRDLFTKANSIFIDHDHSLGCHPGEKHACDACRRGLLCLRCNVGLGYIERMGDMARDYLHMVSMARRV